MAKGVDAKDAKQAKDASDLMRRASPPNVEPRAKLAGEALRKARC